MKLTDNFMLDEMVASHIAETMSIAEQFKPPSEVIGNLLELCNHVLEPIRSLAGVPIKISSGYRCPALNAAVKGSSTSQHLKGESADVDLGSRSANKILFETIKKSGIVWDQMIWEYGDEKGPDWVHISYRSKAKNRMQVIRIR